MAPQIAKRLPIAQRLSCLTKPKPLKRLSRLSNFACNRFDTFYIRVVDTVISCTARMEIIFFQLSEYIPIGIFKEYSLRLFQNS